jgi:glyceraldehyde-3-phosphate dehydrogenase/erythrose-4-phosphate dehydrogenase
MSKLRVGLVGLGVMGKNHLRVLSSLAQVELVGLADPLSAKNMSKDSSFGVFEDYKELLTDIEKHYKQSQALQLLQPDVSKSVCKNCNKPFVMHSRASGLCPDRFKHFE